MRKLFLVLSLLGFVSTSAFALGDTQLDHVIRLRAEGARQGSAVRLLKLVRLSDADANDASLVSGDAVVYDTVSDDGVTVVETTSSADGAFAGIIAMTIQTADSTTTDAYGHAGRRNWGWMIVHGPANANVTAGGTNGHAAGDLFITSTDAGTVTTIANRAGAIAAATTSAEVRRVVGGNGGFFLDAVDASATSAEVFVENV